MSSAKEISSADSPSTSSTSHPDPKPEQDQDRDKDRDQPTDASRTNQADSASITSHSKDDAPAADAEKISQELNESNATEGDAAKVGEVDHEEKEQREKEGEVHRGEADAGLQKEQNTTEEGIGSTEAETAAQFEGVSPKPGKEGETDAREKDGNWEEVEKAREQADEIEEHASPPPAPSDALQQSQNLEKQDQESDQRAGPEKSTESSEKEAPTSDQAQEGQAEQPPQGQADQPTSTSKEGEESENPTDSGPSDQKEEEEAEEKEEPKSDPSSSTSTSINESTAPSSNSDESSFKSDADGKVKIVLKLNQELIRLCINLQTQGKGGQEVFNDVTSRLHSNLNYLASVAEQFQPASKRRSASSLPRLDPFPSGSLPAESPLSGLYDSLREAFKTELQSGTRPMSSTPSQGTKRERVESEVSQEGRKKQAIEDPRNSNSTSTSVSTSSSNIVPHESSIINESAQNVSTPLNNLLASAPTPPTSGTPIQTHNIAPVATAPPSQQQQQVNTPMNAQHAQSLANAYGPHALGYLQALQSHARGVPHPFVSYMESNFPAFRTAPVQIQLQQMIAVRTRNQQQLQAQQASSSHSQSPIQQPSPMGMHNRSGSMGGSPAPQGSPVSRLPIQTGGVNPSDLMGNSGGPGSSTGSPAFSNINMSRPGTAQDGSRPSTPAMIGTPGSSGGFTPGGTNLGMVNGMPRSHARQGSTNGSPMMVNSFPQQPHPQQQLYQSQQPNPYQNFNPQSTMGSNYNLNGMGNPSNPNPNGGGTYNPYSSQQQQQFVNNFQSLPPHIQQQMAQQMSSMSSSGNFQGMNAMMNANGMGMGMGMGNVGGIDMNSMMGNYQPQQQQQQQQNQNQWNNGR